MANDVLEIGQILLDGAARVVSRLASGELADVYIIEMDGIDGPIRQALKVLRREFIGDAQAENRFIYAVQMLRALQVRGIPRVLQFDRLKADHLLFLRMQLIEGPTLAEQIRSPRAPAWACSIIRDLALTIEELHEAQVAHGHIAPSHIRMNRSSAPYLMKLSTAVSVATQADRDVEREAIEQANAQRGPLSAIPLQFSIPDPPPDRGDEPHPSLERDGYDLFVTLYAMLAGASIEATPTWGEPFALPQSMTDRLPPRLQEFLERGLNPSPSAPWSLPTFRSELTNVIDQELEHTRPASVTGHVVMQTARDRQVTAKTSADPEASVAASPSLISPPLKRLLRTTAVTPSLAKERVVQPRVHPEMTERFSDSELARLRTGFRKTSSLPHRQATAVTRTTKTPQERERIDTTTSAPSPEPSVDAPQTPTSLEHATTVPIAAQPSTVDLLSRDDRTRANTAGQVVMRSRLERPTGPTRAQPQTERMWAPNIASPTGASIPNEPPAPPITPDPDAPVARSNARKAKAPLSSPEIDLKDRSNAAGSSQHHQRSGLLPSSISTEDADDDVPSDVMFESPPREPSGKTRTPPRITPWLAGIAAGLAVVLASILWVVWTRSAPAEPQPTSESAAPIRTAGLGSAIQRATTTPRQPPFSTQPSTPSQACSQRRRAASTAFDKEDWVALLALTEDATCWDDHVAWERLRIPALLKQGEYERCIQLGERSESTEVQQHVEACRLRINPPRAGGSH